MPAPTREERGNREQEFRAQCLLVWGILVGRATGAEPGGAGAIAYNQLATRAGIGGDGQGRAGRYSIRINRQWRICFSWSSRAIRR